MTKEGFAFYLEELAHELRGTQLSREYIDDIFSTLRRATDNFYNESMEYCRLKLIKDE